MKKNVYEIITERILEQLAKGTIPWRKPWTGGHDGAYSYATGKSYSILNQILLKHSDAYLTWNQIKALGGSVKKGAKSEIVTFWKQLPIEVEDEEGNKVTKRIPFLRYYQVFWIGDTEGIERKEIKRTELDPVETAESFVNTYMTSANHPTLERDKVSGRAYYRPSTDTVVVPEIGQFSDISEYYSTLFHELTHSTGHTSRLNRLTQTAHFGSDEYSKEELVAEIGAATLVNMAGIETKASFNNSASYIEGWSSVLRENVKMIVEASSKAGKAVDYILGKDSKPTDPDDDTTTTPEADKAPETTAETETTTETAETVKPEAKKAARKSNTQKAFDFIAKSAAHSKANPIPAGTYKGITYAIDGYQILRTTETIDADLFELEDYNAHRMEGFFKEGQKVDKAGMINLTLKQFKDGIKEAKAGRRNAKVMYTTPEGITFNANFLYNAMLATGSTEYRWTTKKAPAYFENDTTQYIVLPIHTKIELAEGFSVQA